MAERIDGKPTDAEFDGDASLLPEQSLGLITQKELLPTSGIELYYIHKPGPFSVTIAIDGGSLYDTVPGIAHAFEQSASAAGTPHFGKKSEIGRFLDPFGGSYGATTGPQAMYFDAYVAQGTDADKAILVVTDVFARPQLDETKVRTELGVVRSEIIRKLGNPAASLYDVWRKLFFQGTALAHNNMGTIEDIDTLIAKPSLITDFGRSLLQRDRLLFTACGDIPIERVIEAFEKNLPELPQQPQTFQRPSGELPLIRNTKIAVHEDKNAGETVHAMLGFRTASIDSEDTPALRLMQAIFSGGESARLPRILHEERGLIDSVRAEDWRYSGAGTFAMVTNTTRDKLQVVIDALAEQFALLRDHGVSEAELQFHKQRMVNSLPLSLQRARTLSRSYAVNELETRGFSLDQRVAEISALTPADMQLVAQKYFTDERSYLALAGNIQPDDVEVTIPDTTHTVFGGIPVPEGLYREPRGVLTMHEQTPRSFSSLEEQSRERTETILPGGVRLVVFERPGPFEISAFTLGGERYEPLDRKGIAGMLTRMIPASTLQFHRSSDLSSYLERFGGRYGVSYGNERLEIGVAVGNTANAPQAINVMVELLTGSTFDEEPLQSEKEGRLDALSDRRTDPEVRIEDVWQNLVFQGTAMAVSLDDIAQTTREISADELRVFRRQVLNRDNLLLVATGNCTAEQISALFEEHRDKLETLPKTHPLLPQADLSPQPTQRIALDPREGADQTNMKLGFRTCDRNDPDVPVLSVIATILTGSRSARLHTALKENPTLGGLTYALSTDRTHLSDTGYFAIKTQTPADTAIDVIAAITHEFERLANGDMPEEEIERMKQRMLIRQPITLETAGDWLSFHGSREFSGKGDLTEHSAAIRAVTKDDIVRVARKYFKPEALLIALSGHIPENPANIL